MDNTVFLAELIRQSTANVERAIASVKAGAPWGYFADADLRSLQDSIKRLEEAIEAAEHKRPFKTEDAA